MDTQEYERRKTLVHLIRSGQSVEQAAKEVGRSRSWGNKWWGRFRVNQEWEDLRDRPRIPTRQPRKLPLGIRQAIRRARSELEADAQEQDRLGYVGAFAIQARLREWNVQPVPGITSIERELRVAGLVRPRHTGAPAEVPYPHLHPTRPHELIQADILPRYLTGGTAVACFNAIDVVSRYPSGRQYANRTARNACDFLWSVWQEQGIPAYQQVDNEGCFSGGFTHPGVLGQVLRLGLLVGTHLVFSPFYHPESNGTVERFHQDYAHFVWKKDRLPDLPAVRQRSALFYRNYRASRHHSQLQGRSPTECHPAQPSRQLLEGFRLPKHLPLTVGQVHFIRAVDQQRQVKVLNLNWNVPQAQPNQGVWVTLTLTPSGATLSVFDAAPDAAKRTCLAQHPFPLKEEVVPLAKEFQPKRQQQPAWFDLATRALGYLVSRLSTMS
ncbi:MAG: integrase core domain-containing protein [Ardenticatenaceae bacterium]|nr:integrase core domain-containing protein [Ardenticatenaceae bacterium]MCZ7574994.1 integrase core domain-containing protein [Ardenticatenaceae bacterium]